MRFSCVFLASAFLLWAGHVMAGAAPCTPEPRDFSKLPESLVKVYERRAADIKAMDKDCDGVLQTNELETATKSSFAGADADKDGFLSAGESVNILNAFARQQESQNQASGLIERREGRLEKRLYNMDQNEDDRISAQEYQTYFTQRYQKLDKDGNGVLDIGEYETTFESR